MKTDYNEMKKMQEWTGARVFDTKRDALLAYIREFYSA